jgi:hypothetical protein
MFAGVPRNITNKQNNKITPMKKLMVCGCAIAVAGLFTGCVPITYQKSVTTHLDSSGHVTGTDITEVVTEPHNETPRIVTPAAGIQLNHIQQQ